MKELKCLQKIMVIEEELFVSKIKYLEKKKRY